MYAFVFHAGHIPLSSRHSSRGWYRSDTLCVCPQRSVVRSNLTTRIKIDKISGVLVSVTPLLSNCRNRFSDVDYEMKLRKVYFFWICPDMNSFEWFQVLLNDLERQLIVLGKEGFLEYNIFLSRGWNNIQVR